MVSGELKTLKALDTQGVMSIQRECGRTHGGQAVGCGFDFLFAYHMLPVYLMSSVILAAGCQSWPEKRGGMGPGESFRENLMCDCDYRTCVPEHRGVLSQGMYMQDMGATRSMLDSCFRLLATYFLLRGIAAEQQGIERRLSYVLHQAFGFENRHE